jgi:pimeloyl-ACP methyl ester carboxylesterase
LLPNAGTLSLRPLNLQIDGERYHRPMVEEHDLDLGDGRALHVYDSGESRVGTSLVVFWHHGTPQLGAPPGPLLPASAHHGIRWVSHDRPGYGGSTPQPGRDLAAVAADVATIADKLGIGQFAVMGYSGGGPHALACAALLPDRVLGVVCVAALAPFGADGLDWFTGMATGGEAGLRAAVDGRAALEAHLAGADFDPESFTPADHAALSRSWSWLGSVSGPETAGVEGMLDDDVAYVRPWGLEPEQVDAPVLLLHGDDDHIVPHSHAHWLASHCPSAELWLSPGDGHLSILTRSEAALGWLGRRRAGAVAPTRDR